MHEEENYFCSLSGSKPSKIPRFDYEMQSRDHFLLQTSAHHHQQQQLRYGGNQSPQQQQQLLLQQHRHYENHSPQQQKQHHQRFEMLTQEIIPVPTGPIYFQQNTDWKSNFVYQAPPLEQWNPNLIGKVDSIWRTYLISLGQLQYKGF